MSGPTEDVVEVVADAGDEESGAEIEPRITCDIAGSDRYCAVHCIAKGFRGGYCNAKKVCVCRR